MLGFKKHKVQQAHLMNSGLGESGVLESCGQKADCNVWRLGWHSMLRQQFQKAGL